MIVQLTREKNNAAVLVNLDNVNFIYRSDKGEYSVIDFGGHTLKVVENQVQIYEATVAANNEAAT